MYESWKDIEYMLLRFTSLISSPPIFILPEYFLYIPHSSFNNVDLPDPFLPIIATLLPKGIENETSLNIRVSLYEKVKFSIVIS